MTGPEVVVGKAAASVAGKVLPGSEHDSTLDALAAESPNMKAAAESRARRVALKEAALLKVFAPLGRFVGLSKEYFATDFHTDMARKLTDIPDEHLTTPSPALAIPAMEALRYSVDEPDLKEMYLNLLATATDSRRSDEAHPSFADIIRQLSPGEARWLHALLHQSIRAVARLAVQEPEGQGFETALSYLLEVRDDETGEVVEQPPLQGMWIDNWERLGLIKVDFAYIETGDGKYDWVTQAPEYLRLVEQDARGADAIRVDEGIVRRTDFGELFRKAVSYDGIDASIEVEDASS